MKSDELAVHISFAKLELLELERGRRTLTQCPGIEKIADEIRKAKAVAALAPGRRPCECVDRCLYPGYGVGGDRTPPQGVVCRERSALPRLSEGPL